MKKFYDIMVSLDKLAKKILNFENKDLKKDVKLNGEFDFITEEVLSLIHI